MVCQVLVLVSVSKESWFWEVSLESSGMSGAEFSGQTQVPAPESIIKWSESGLVRMWQTVVS